MARLIEVEVEESKLPNRERLGEADIAHNIPILNQRFLTGANTKVKNDRLPELI